MRTCDYERLNSIEEYKGHDSWNASTLIMVTVDFSKVEVER